MHSIGEGKQEQREQMMAETLTGDKNGRWKRKEKNVEERSERANREQLPNCGDLETGETNGSVPLLGEIMKHLK